MNNRENIQQQALESVAGRTRSGLGISMGVGKTLIGLKHMNDLYVNQGMRKFLVVAPKKSIYTTWVDDAKKFALSHLEDCMEFTTYLSLTKKDNAAYQAIYLDECHSLLYSHELWLATYGGIILGLTGTPPRFKNSEKGYMVDRFCPITYTYITDDAVEDGILNDYRIIIHPIILSDRKDYLVKTAKKEFYSSEQANYAYWCDRVYNAVGPKDEQITRIMRMTSLMNYPGKMRYAKRLLQNIEGKCLVFCNTQAQADNILPNSYHSNNPYSDENLIAFKTGEIDRLSCVLSLSEGVNIPDLRNCIIMHAYSNERKSTQRIGRLLRLNPDETATIHILMYKNTVDESWVNKALEDLDPSKIHILENTYA